MKKAVILSAARTPVGDFNGIFKDVSALDLGSIVINEVIKRAGIKKEDVEEVIMGNVLPAGLGQNPARQAMIRAGIPMEAAGLTITKSADLGLKPSCSEHRPS